MNEYNEDYTIIITYQHVHVCYDLALIPVPGWHWFELIQDIEMSDTRYTHVTHTLSELFVIRVICSFVTRLEGVSTFFCVRIIFLPLQLRVVCDVRAIWRQHV